MSNSDIKTQLENNFMKAFRDKGNVNANDNRQYAFTKESEFDPVDYYEAKDVKNRFFKMIKTQFPNENPNYDIRNNLKLNNASGLGTTQWGGYNLTVYAKPDGDYKILDYNRSDGRINKQIVRRNGQTEYTSKMGGDGFVSNGMQSRENANADEVVSREQGSGLRINGFSEGDAVNQRNNTDGREYSISEAINENVKQFSISDYATSNNGDEVKLTENQREYFKDSKVVDEKGNLQIVYHSSPSTQFCTFDKSKASPESNLGAGFLIKLFK